MYTRDRTTDMSAFVEHPLIWPLPSVKPTQGGQTIKQSSCDDEEQYEDQNEENEDFVIMVKWSLLIGVTHGSGSTL